VTIWEARPPNSKFLHRVETDLEKFKDLIIFSLNPGHKHTGTWSHDEDFPWFLTHPNPDFVIKEPGEKYVVAATLLEEWSMAYQGNITMADNFVLSEVVEFWRRWRETS